MQKYGSLFDSMLRGYLAGWLSTFAAGSAGFLVGSIALARGVALSTDFSSTPWGLVGLVVSGIALLGVPTSLIGSLLAGFLYLTRALSTKRQHGQQLVAIVVLAAVWVIAFANEALPFQHITANAQAEVGSAVILGVFVLATLVSVLWVAGRMGQRGIYSWLMDNPGTTTQSL